MEMKLTRGCLGAALLLATEACADRMTAAEPAAPRPSSAVTELLRGRPAVQVRGAPAPAGARIQICRYAAMSPEHPPLYVIDGRRISHKEIHSLAIEPAQIADIYLVKGTAARELYGEEAAYGVVLVTLKH